MNGGIYLIRDSNQHIQRIHTAPSINHLVVQGSKVTIYFSKTKNDQLPFLIKEMLCTSYLEQMKPVKKLE